MHERNRAPTTYRVTLNIGVSHLASEIRVNGKNKGLHEESTLEGDILEVDSV